MVISGEGSYPASTMGYNYSQTFISTRAVHLVNFSKLPNKLLPRTVDSKAGAVTSTIGELKQDNYDFAFAAAAPTVFEYRFVYCSNDP